MRPTLTTLTLSLLSATLLLDGATARADDREPRRDAGGAAEALDVHSGATEQDPTGDGVSSGHDLFELELQASSTLSLGAMTGVRPIPPLVILAGLEWRYFSEDTTRGLGVGGLGGLGSSNEATRLTVPLAVKLYLGGGGLGVQPLVRVTGGFSLGLGENDQTSWSVGAGGGVAYLLTDDFGLSTELFARYEQSRLDVPGVPTIETEWVNVGAQMGLFARL